MYAVPDRCGPTSGMWAAYGGIQAMGFAHLQVNHTYNFVTGSTEAHTPQHRKRVGKLENAQ